MKNIIFILLFVTKVCFSQGVILDSDDSLMGALFYKESYSRHLQVVNTGEQLVLHNVTLHVPKGIKITSSNCEGLLETNSLKLAPYQRCQVQFELDSSTLNAVIQGTIRLQGFQNEQEVDSNNLFVDFHVSPHQLSMYGIPEQKSVVGVNFELPLQKYVAYLDENEKAGQVVSIGVGSDHSNGLYFDAKANSLIGYPLQTGTYRYQVSASNDLYQTKPVTLVILVGYDKSKEPQLNNPDKLPTANFSKVYDYDLETLIVGEDKDVTFFFDRNRYVPDWLKIENNHLSGYAPKSRAGQIEPFFIFAHSNTGGDSEKVKIQLPVAQDEAMKPIIKEDIQLIAQAGEYMWRNLQASIVDPSQDPNLRLIIDKVEPLAPWLSASSHEPTTLIGKVPIDSIGQEYTITLHANNEKGGDSIAQTVKLKIDINESFKPEFKADNPQLPIMYLGQTYFHDFQQNRDVFPEYEDAPYTIKFAEGYTPPSWLIIDNNQLKSIGVIPIDGPDEVVIKVVINNRVGGNSDVVQLVLFVMD